MTDKILNANIPNSRKGDLVIVGDIGGTNGRFAIAEITSGAPNVREMHIYQSADYTNLGPMLGKFLTDVGNPNTVACRLAVAGPAQKDSAYLTNLGWDVNARAIETELGIKDVGFLNDFGALAFAASVVEKEHTLRIKSGSKVENAPMSMMGPGTGFGLSLLVPNNTGGYSVVETEGGHVAFAPVTPLEEDLLKFLRREHGHVSVETLLCGRGLERIHRFLVTYGGSGNPDLTPAEISAAAHDGTQPSALRAVQLFLSILGSVAGDVALTHGAKGGVYFGGGILPKIANQIETSDLVTRFTTKGIMSEYLTNIPIHLITAPDAALIGAAASV